MYLDSLGCFIKRLAGYMTYACSPGSSSFNSFLFFIALFRRVDRAVEYIWVTYMGWTFGVLLFFEV